MEQTARSVSSRRFTHGYVVPLDDYEFEIVTDVLRSDAPLVESLREAALRVAAESRGYTAPEDLALFREHYKIEPLYEASRLALVRKQQELVGLAGAVTNWHVTEGAIVHLCSLAFSPQMQTRGFLPLLLSTLWNGVLTTPALRDAAERERLYVTAITQSPQILDLIARVATQLYPSPARTRAPAIETGIAQRVAHRFDAHIPFDSERFILREECRFRYRSVPYSRDDGINALCDQSLRYDHGDVFVVVGRLDLPRVLSLLDATERKYPSRFRRLNRGLFA